MENNENKEFTTLELFEIHTPNDVVGYVYSTILDNHMPNLKFLVSTVKIDLNDPKLPPLWVAVAHKRYEIAKFLIEAGANVNLKNSHGLSLLAFSKEKNFKKMINLLTKNGAKE